MKKRIIFEGSKSSNSMLGHGFIESSGDLSSIKIIFRPHGKRKVCVEYIGQIYDMFKEYLNTKGFVLEDSGNHTKSLYKLSRGMSRKKGG